MSKYYKAKAKTFGPGWICDCLLAHTGDEMFCFECNDLKTNHGTNLILGKQKVRNKSYLK